MARVLPRQVGHRGLESPAIVRDSTHWFLWAIFWFHGAGRCQVIWVHEWLGCSQLLRRGSVQRCPVPDICGLQWRDDPADLAQQAEVKQLLREALEELDEKYRVVFVLRDIEGYSTQETAQMMGISVSNVKVRLLRARLQLRERLTRVLGDESTQMAVPEDHQH